MALPPQTQNANPCLKGSGPFASSISPEASPIVVCPDLIMTNGTPTTLAVIAETHGIPVHFFNVPDPVVNGIDGDLARPGSNVTGFTTFKPSLGGISLQFLNEIATAAV
jgi:hypothetical protein